MNINLRENLYRMRENYSRKPIRFKYLPQLSWLRTNDGLYQIYRDIYNSDIDFDKCKFTIRNSFMFNAGEYYENTGI